VNDCQFVHYPVVDDSHFWLCPFVDLGLHQKNLQKVTMPKTGWFLKDQQDKLEHRKVQILFCWPLRLTMSTKRSCGYGSVPWAYPPIIFRTPTKESVKV